MFLKLKYKNQTKKLKFKPEYHDIETLLDLCTNITGWSRDKLKLKYRDVEGDELSIVNGEDLEYFIEQDKENRFKSIDISSAEIDSNEISSEFKEELQTNMYHPDNNLKEINLSYDNILINLDEELDTSTIYRNDHKTYDISYINNKSIIDLNHHQNPDTLIRDLQFQEWEISNIEESNNKPNDVSTITTANTNSDIIDSPKYNNLNKIISKIEQLTYEFKQFTKVCNYRLDHLESNHVKLTNNLISLASTVNNKLDKTELTSANEKTKAIHKNIVCDSCDVQPIIGKRFTCIECDDYDLCEQCEQKGHHKHEMLQIITSVSQDKLREKVNKLKSTRGINDSEDEMKKIVSIETEVEALGTSPKKEKTSFIKSVFKKKKSSNQQMFNIFDSSSKVIIDSHEIPNQDSNKSLFNSLKDKVTRKCCKTSNNNGYETQKLDPYI